MPKLVSIITPSYNTEAYISKTIESVIEQSYRDWEMIIVDDCSSDKTVHIIKTYTERDTRIKLIQLETNLGPAVARNKAIEASKGRYIAFLDSDDFWHKDKLAKQLDFMEKNKRALTFTAYYSIEEHSGEIIRLLGVPDKVDYYSLLKQDVMGCLTVMYDTKTLGKVTMPSMKRRQDYALWLKILKRVPYAYGLDEPLAYYRVRSNSISSNKIVASRYNWKLYREVEKLPLHKAIYYFCWYAYNGIMKYK